MSSMMSVSNHASSSSNSSSAEPPNTAAMTRFLQQKMLEVCQDYVGFSHQVNILGVVTLTVDDGQQDLVVKFQHIFKRTKQNQTKEGGSTQRDTHVTTSSSGTSMRVHPANQSSPLALNFATTSSPTVNGVANGYAGSSETSERKSGRKRAHPVKVIAQCDADLGSDEEEPITVIPEAPEASLSARSTPSVPDDVSVSSRKNQVLLDAGSGSSSSGAKGLSGSAKRKPSQQFRVPQYQSTTSTPHKNSPHMRQALSGSPFGTDSTENGPQNLSMATNPGLSLPLYIAGIAHAQNGVVNPIEITPENCTDSERDDPSRSPSKSPGELYIDEDNSKVKDDSREQGLFASPLGGGSDTPLDFSRSGTMASIYGLPSSSFVDGSMASQLPFSALSLLSSMRRSDPASDSEGLSIKYTSTGPYTVGANGKDVSNSSRIKDIIMYDEHSPFGGQKGTKMEQDFIVDKLGMDGRKRRRRAPEDQLTPEEIAEYLGQPDVKTEVSFKCKYCTEVFESVTKYIHHTLASHQAYICHQCGKSFTTKSSLLRHRPIHTGMRRFACSICKKTFYRKDKCKAHIKRHLGLDSSASVDAANAGGMSGADANQVAEAYNLSLDTADSATALNLGLDAASKSFSGDSAENSNSAPNQFPQPDIANGAAELQ